MRAKHKGAVLTFGLDNSADVSALEIESLGLGLTRFSLRTPLGEARAELPMPGRHNLTNALAAAAVATVFEVNPNVIAEAFMTAAPSQMRGEVLRLADNVTVVDDSYNSNPQSLIAMAEAIAHVDRKGATRRIVVAGEMLELGPEAEKLHKTAGREIAELGIDVLWGVRGHASALVAGAREAGMEKISAAFFASSEEAGEALVEFVRAGDLILVKGSRGVATERIVDRLKSRVVRKDA
jgi:UDP-N-acetylmuramoyl-tripeptide--D-alanyl-D-alanine ligase